MKKKKQDTLKLRTNGLAERNGDLPQDLISRTKHSFRVLRSERRSGSRSSLSKAYACGGVPSARLADVHVEEDRCARVCQVGSARRILQDQRVIKNLLVFFFFASLEKGFESGSTCWIETGGFPFGRKHDTTEREGERERGIHTWERERRRGVKTGGGHRSRVHTPFFPIHPFPPFPLPPRGGETWREGPSRTPSLERSHPTRGGCP